MFFITDKNVVKKYKSVDSLKDIYYKKSIDLIKNRSKIRICVLDDVGFDPQQLIKMGYTNVSVRENFDDISDFKNYNLVLCDVDGVGVQFNPVKQGIAIAEEITRAYSPFTQVAIYTGKELADYEYQEIEGVKVIEKNIPNSRLVEEIDEICQIFWNPIKTWDILENYFRKKKLSNKVIMILEDIFVNAAINMDESDIISRTSKLNKGTIQQIISLGFKFAIAALKIYYEN